MSADVPAVVAPRPLRARIDALERRREQLAGLLGSREWHPALCAAGFYLGTLGPLIHVFTSGVPGDMVYSAVMMTPVFGFAGAVAAGLIGVPADALRAVAGRLTGSRASGAAREKAEAEQRRIERQLRVLNGRLDEVLADEIEARLDGNADDIVREGTSEAAADALALRERVEKIDARIEALQARQHSLDKRMAPAFRAPQAVMLLALLAFVFCFCLSGGRGGWLAFVAGLLASVWSGVACRMVRRLAGSATELSLVRAEAARSALWSRRDELETERQRLKFELESLEVEQRLIDV